MGVRLGDLCNVGSSGNGDPSLLVPLYEAFSYGFYYPLNSEEPKASILWLTEAPAFLEFPTMFGLL